jgi:hypothetical protein
MAQGIVVFTIIEGASSGVGGRWTKFAVGWPVSKGGVLEVLIESGCTHVRSTSYVQYFERALLVLFYSITNLAKHGRDAFRAACGTLDLEEEVEDLDGEQGEESQILL